MKMMNKGLTSDTSEEEEEEEEKAEGKSETPETCVLHLEGNGNVRKHPMKFVVFDDDDNTMANVSTTDKKVYRIWQKAKKYK
jgi:hypothetical protein